MASGGASGAAGASLVGAGSASLSIILGMEKEKVRLSAAAARDARAAAEADASASALSARVDAARTRLGSLNALFARLPDAAARAPRQRLGAREAVLSTKRILGRELERLGNERVVAEGRLNRARERNAGVRERVDELRRERATSRGLLTKMTAELAALKAAIAGVAGAIDGEYAQRDRAHDEARDDTSWANHSM